MALSTLWLGWLGWLASACAGPEQSARPGPAPHAAAQSTATSTATGASSALAGSASAMALTGSAQPAPAAQLSASIGAETPTGSAVPAQLISKLDQLVQAAIRRGDAPGAVVVLLHGGQVVLQRSYGERAHKPSAEPMQLDTLFDAASLTKPVVTASLIMQLAAEGRLSLSDRVSHYLPPFRVADKAAITIEQLLSHTSGLPAANPLSDFDDPTVLLERIASRRLSHRPGTRRDYSDVGYIVLGALLTQLTGQSLAELAEARLFAPLNMTDSSFGVAESLRQRAAPTEQREGKYLRGSVHDPRAARLNGQAGHAGLFTTASDLAHFVQMMLAGGRWQGRQLLPKAAINRMLFASVPASPHALAYFRSDGGYGHTGFTGTSLWFDPLYGDGAIVLTSRLHAGTQSNVTQLRQQVRQLVKEHRNMNLPVVTTGVDALIASKMGELSGRRIGLITHDAARSHDGRRSADVLAAAPQLKLVELFSPEHGLGARADGLVSDSHDRVTGVHVTSLYGRERKPQPQQLKNIDTLVIDLQDAGARFYTYLSTLGYALEAAKQSHVRVVVLDRPNPIGGVMVEGPMLDAGRESFIGYHRLPIRHGMTLGEMALLLNAERHIGADLQVVKMRGYRRTQLFADTGLVWYPPSPNLRSAEAALLYPGLALLETTNVSVGRGTEQPFLQIGAPWLDAAALKAALDERGPGELATTVVRFVPSASTQRGQSCAGVRFDVREPHKLASVRLGLRLVSELLRLHRKEFKANQVLGLLGNREAHQLLLAGHSAAEVEQAASADLVSFMGLRKKYLLY